MAEFERRRLRRAIARVDVEVVQAEQELHLLHRGRPSEPDAMRRLRSWRDQLAELCRRLVELDEEPSEEQP